MRHVRHGVMIGMICGAFGGSAGAQTPSLTAEQPGDPVLASYRAHVAAAEYALRLNDVAHAREWLERAPEAWRGFEWRALHAATDGSIADVSREAGAVWEIAVSPQEEDSGGAVVLGLGDGTVVVRERDGRERWRAKAHTSAAYRVDWSPDGARVASSGLDTTVHIFDATSGEEQRVYKGHATPVPGLDFSPDGSLIATASYRMESTPEGGRKVIGTLRVWDPATGEDRFDVDVGVKPISMVRWSPDGKRIAAASWDGEFHIVGAEPGEGEREHSVTVLPETGVYSAINCIAWSPDGTHVVVGSKDRTARVYAVSGESELLGEMRHEGWVTAAVFSPDGARLVTAGEDNLIRVWDAASFQPPTDGGAATLRGHTLGIGSLAFERDGTLLSAGADAVVRRWDIGATDAAGVRFKDSHACYAALFTPDGATIWTCAYDGTIAAWDARTGALVHDVNAHPSGESANTLSMTGDGAVVASCSYDKTVKLWDARTGEAISTLDAPWPVYHAALSPDGASVACVGRGSTVVEIIDVATNRIVRTLDTTPSGLNNVVFSPDGALIAGSGSRGMVRVWRAADGERVRDFEGLGGTVNAIAFTPDGESLVGASTGGIVARWSIASGEKAWECSVGNSSVTRLAVTPDGSRIAAVGEGAHILDAATGLHLATFRPHNDTIWHCAFNADGSRLATTSWDGNVVVIETEPYRVRRAALESKKE